MPLLQGAHSDAADRRFTDRFNQTVAGLGGRIAALTAPSLASTPGSVSPTRGSPLQEKIARLSEQLIASTQPPLAQPRLMAQQRPATLKQLKHQVTLLQGHTSDLEEQAAHFRSTSSALMLNLEQYEHGLYTISESISLRCVTSLLDLWRLNTC